MQKRTTQVLLVALIALVTAIVIACGDSGSQGVTPDPVAYRATQAAKPTADIFGRRASEPIREIERSLEKLNSLVARFDERITRARRLSGDPPEEPDDWFDECCEGVEEDIFDELLDAEEQVVELIAIYREAADEPNLQIVQQLGTPLANIDALVMVLAGLPTSDGAAPILEDMSLEIVALSEVFAGLG